MYLMCVCHLSGSVGWYLLFHDAGVFYIFMTLLRLTLTASFVIKFRLFDEAGKEKLAISMEVCRVQRMELTGLKLTRLKGDTWAFKKVCVDLLK